MRSGVEGAAPLTLLDKQYEPGYTQDHRCLSYHTQHLERPQQSSATACQKAMDSRPHFELLCREEAGCSADADHLTASHLCRSPRCKIEVSPRRGPSLQLMQIG